MSFDRRAFLAASVAAAAAACSKAVEERAAGSPSPAAPAKFGIPGPYPGRVVAIHHPGSIISGAYQASIAVADGPNDGPEYADTSDVDQNGFDTTAPGSTWGRAIEWRCGAGGTALGERHLQVLRRYTDIITLVLDGDEAGRRRTNEILDALLALFEKNEVDLRILTLPEGLDPCDFIATHGSDQFRQLVDHAVDALEHKFKTVTNGLDTLTDTHRVSQAAEQMLATLAQIRQPGAGATSQALLREDQMLSRIARQFSRAT